MLDVVVGEVFDVLGAGGGVVVEDFVGAEAFEVGEVTGGGGGDDGEAGEFGVLDGEGAGGESCVLRRDLCVGLEGFVGAGRRDSFALRACEKVRFVREAEPLDRRSAHRHSRRCPHLSSRTSHINSKNNTTPISLAVVLL